MRAQPDDGAEDGRTARRRLLLAYDGAPFAGWQVQPDRRTVQGEIEEALERLLGRRPRVVGAGRTDAGVHALGQVAHFDDAVDWPHARLRAALNASLPPSIRVLALDAAPAGFHALHSASGKTYVYQLHLSAEAGGQRAVEGSVPPLRRATFHAVRADLDLAAMRAAAARLVGRRDFTALSKAMPPGRTPIKHLRSVRVLRIPRGLRIVATADGFLYGMVRLLAGLLVAVGSGRLTPADVERVLAARDRAAAAPSLPAHALFLWKVRYALRPGPELRDPDRRLLS